MTTYLALKRAAAEDAAFEARTQLARMARIHSLGELTASIAHEINQPLAAIATSGSACQRWLEPVSYTHLDVYKRQTTPCPAGCWTA